MSRGSRVARLADPLLRAYLAGEIGDPDQRKSAARSLLPPITNHQRKFLSRFEGGAMGLAGVRADTKYEMRALIALIELGVVRREHCDPQWLSEAEAMDGGEFSAQWGSQ
jgi:hypothetical protein